MDRGLILGAIAFGIVFAAERQYEAFDKDVKRYNAMRAMSGEPPLFQQIWKGAAEMIAGNRAGGQGEVKDLLASLTADIVRYATMRSI